MPSRSTVPPTGAEHGDLDDRVSVGVGVGVEVVPDRVARSPIS